MDMSKKSAGETRAPAAIRSFLRGLRILSRFALRMTSRLVVANTIRRADKLSFSCHCEAVQTAVAIRSLLRVLRILSRFAFRMTGRLVIVNAARRAAIRFPLSNSYKQKKPPVRRFFNFSLNLRRKYRYFRQLSGAKRRIGKHRR